MPGGRIDRARAVFWLQAASLAATAFVVWKFSLRPQLDQNSLGMLAGRALVVTVLAAMWGAVITLVLLLAIARVERDRVWRVSLRTSAAAIWFAPATILLSASSPVYLAAAIALVFSATRLLYSQWRTAALPARADPALSVLESGGIRSGFLPRDPGMSLAAGLSVQAAVSGWLMGASLLAAALCSLAVAILTVFAASKGLLREDRPSLPRSVFGFALTILLAVGLMVTGLHRGRGGGEGSGAEMATVKTTKDMANPPNYRLAKSGDFPGVILRPEHRPVPLLVEPTPSRSQFAHRSPDHPFSIPFDGEYWLYRWPFSSPPAGSFIYHGSPTNVSYRSTDETPLRMDAHQVLDREIDLSCCSKVEIEILNADTHPGSVVLELLVADRGARLVSLGSQPVISHPDGSLKPVRAVSETLEFSALPMNIDEIKVQFHRMLSRTGRSARIAINRFLLVPR